MDKLLKEILKELKAIRKELKRNNESSVSISAEKLIIEDDEDYVLYITDEGMSKYGSN